jgi:hypothetical protein
MSKVGSDLRPRDVLGPPAEADRLKQPAKVRRGPRIQIELVRLRANARVVLGEAALEQLELDRQRGSATKDALLRGRDFRLAAEVGDVHAEEVAVAARPRRAAVDFRKEEARRAVGEPRSARLEPRRAGLNRRVATTCHRSRNLGA